MGIPRLHKVGSKEALHDKIDDYQIKGYHVVETVSDRARLHNNNYGTVGMHILCFLLTFFTYGFGNLIYGLYVYLTKSKEVVVKIGKGRATNCGDVVVEVKYKLVE